MNREQAIRELNTFKIGAKSELGETALYMAIKALEQEPCEDCISRQAAIDALKRAEALTRAFGYHVVIDTIRELPSAETEPNTGYWVSQRGGDYRCSECGRYALDEVDGYFIHLAFKSNFCPYCGADMRGEQDG